MDFLARQNDPIWPKNGHGRIWPFCPVKQSMHALRSNFGHRSLLAMVTGQFITLEIENGRQCELI